MCRESCDAPVTLSLLTMRPEATENTPRKAWATRSVGSHWKLWTGFLLNSGPRTRQRPCSQRQGRETGGPARTGEPLWGRASPIMGDCLFQVSGGLRK